CGTYVYYHYEHSAEFSKKLCDYISASTGRDNEGAEQGYYSVTRLTMCPAVMLEVGFVSNPKELESLINPADIQKTAIAVTKAVLEILDN
ncbi:MAG: N-acetylmuramoyl-L-alanine amidase, partial [Oscillospiraceae bacterium]|nr:N-acetylmuramoyl-L-alanine amidase [Oscillospiraceae bacterium]